MGAREPMLEGPVERLTPLFKEAHSKAQYQRVPCVWMRATLGLSASEITKALGWQASSVRPVQARDLREGEDKLRDQPHGGVIIPISRVKKNGNCWHPFWQERNRVSL